MVKLVTLTAFWRRKEPRIASASPRVIPLPNLAPSTLTTSRVTTLEDVNRAREALKLLKLERQILGSAVTTIYESQTKGVITEVERDHMLEKYKIELKRLDKDIQENQKVVDLSDLEIEREEAAKAYKARLAEIDAKLKELRSGSPSVAPTPILRLPQQTHQPENKTREVPSVQSSQDQQVTDAEKRIEKIRGEILEAMDRLEQIEAEG